MMVKVTAITARGEWREFSLLHVDLEVTYDVLYTIAGQGDRLITATLMDQQGSLALPLDDLDDLICSNPFQALRQQWEEHLTQPVRSPLSTSQLTQQCLWLRERILGLENHLIRFENSRVTSRQLYEQSLRNQDDPQKRSAMMERYTVHINRHWDCTRRMKAMHQQALYQLGILEAN